MAKPPNYSTTAPVYTVGGPSVAGGYGNYSNVTIAGSGLTYATGTNWSTAIAEPYYTKKPKVQITDKDIELDGLSLRQTLLDLQARMAIMVPNPKLEEEFAELRECADRYRELERKLLDQKVMWKTLKNTDNK